MREAVEGAAYLREQAEKCVRLAESIPDPEAAAALRNLAMEYQIRAEQSEEEAMNGMHRPAPQSPDPT